MPCGTSNSNYPDYLKSIIKAIEAGNDETLKACACNLRSCIGVDTLRYFLPTCVYNPVDHPQLYTEVVNAGIPLLPVDPQKIMELFFKYKSFDVQLFGNKDAAGKWDTSCEEAGDDNPNQGTWAERVTLEKQVGRLQQVCLTTPFFAGAADTVGMDCDVNETEPYGANLPAFNQFLLFFMQPYVEPECGEPGPTLYQASLAGMDHASTAVAEGSYNGVTLATYQTALFGGTNGSATW